MDMTQFSPTELIFQRDGSLLETTVTLKACTTIAELPEPDTTLFKDSLEGVYAVITDKTIFHAQGGGQPSDTGTIVHDKVEFKVLSARTSATISGLILHFGRFNEPGDSFTTAAGSQVLQKVNAERRLLYSKYHTAGHVLGAAVRHLLEKEVDGFDELKASHFPDSASCEFAGSIAGSHKDDVQKKVDEYIKAAMPVEIDWWSEDDFRSNGLERLIPDEHAREAMGVKPGDAFRVVKIVGAEVYPCGGTHVATTDECGKTNVKKVSRSKGTSRVSYNLPEA